ncbi:glycosyltransferase family 2 protein [Rhodococcus pyridinivorans]|uniref:glycosyltransferase family 2 protein n=1 Tax=Rhodococcus pyridinivorans TaxID=103816 RepID=UPI00369EA427
MIVVLVIFILGLGTIVWACIGSMRFIYERAHAARRTEAAHIAVEDVAVLLAAHNEAVVIAGAIEAAAALVARKRIHVVSDGSSDATAEIARRLGVRVLELERNRGKAGALSAGLEHFELCDRFEVVLLLDADTRLSPDYLQTGLPLFDDPGVVAVAGCVRGVVDKPAPTVLGRLLVAYRERLYVIVQLLFKYGQAARRINVVNIVPGFASMYRTAALSRIDIAAPGLVIEDFNMTFEVHAKKLGRIAFRPGSAVAYTEDPDNPRDYVRQISRWNLGFWQTVRRHGLRHGLFWTVLALHLIELIISSVLLVLVVPLLVVHTFVRFAEASDIGVVEPIRLVATTVGLEAVLFGLLLPDFLLTVFAAWVLRRPSYLVFGLVFPVVRILDAYICLSAVPRTFSTQSNGSWASPTRRSSPIRPDPVERIPATRSATRYSALRLSDPTRKERTCPLKPL